jgi:diphthamide biosynthesis protein 3
MADIDENIYDTIEIEDLDFEKRNLTFYYPCPCGDKFAITLVIILIFIFFRNKF